MTVRTPRTVVPVSQCHTTSLTTHSLQRYRRNPMPDLQQYYCHCRLLLGRKTETGESCDHPYL